MAADLFILCADILVYVAWYRTYQIWLQAPCKFLTGSRRVLAKAVEDRSENLLVLAPVRAYAYVE
jgi:hypothetical protein